MTRVAAYCRVSTDREDQANSFDAQQRYFREYITRRPDWTLHGIYADEGITGTSTKKRTEFNRMIADAHAGCFSLILSKEVSRFSRNILDTITYTRDLKRIGVGVYFLTENLNTLKPEAEMLLTFMGILSQEESRRTSVRVKWGQTRRMEQGVVFGRSLLGYDVNNGHLTINEPEAELVRLIFRRYGIEGKSSSAIAKELTAAGYLTKSGSSRWSPGHIVKLLRNEKYTGDLIQKKSITPDYLTHAKKPNHGEEELIVLRDHHVPIISRELWNTVQSELSRRSRKAGTARSACHLFSGKILCGECGAAFLSRQKHLKNGAAIRRWACGTAVTKGAANCRVGRLLRDDDARSMLRLALCRLDLDREAVITRLLAILSDAAGAGEGDIRRQLDVLNRKRTAALDAFCAGDLSAGELHALKDRYDRQYSALAQHLTPAVIPDAEPLLRALLSGDTESDTLYRAVLAQITVYADRRLQLRLKGLSQVFHFL